MTDRDIVKVDKISYDMNTESNNTSPAHMMKYVNGTLPEKSLNGPTEHIYFPHNRTEYNPSVPVPSPPTIRGGRGVDRGPAHAYESPPWNPEPYKKLRWA